MTETALREIVHRAVRDAAYRTQLQNDPASALAGISLTAEEREAVTTGDPARLTALGVERLMSKAFAAGVVGDASKVIVLDPGAGGGTALDEATAAGMSPLWRIERDLDATPASVDADATFDANALRPLESESGVGSSVEQPASGMSPLWRIEQDLDTAGAEVTDANQDANWDGNTPSDY